MDGSESSAVLEEVEALFKKLQHLPENIRQRALSCIQEKLPDAAPGKDEEGASSEEKEPTTSPRKGSLVQKNVLPAKITRRSSAALRERQNELEESVQHEVELLETNSEEIIQKLPRELEKQVAESDSSDKADSVVKSGSKVTPKRYIKIPSVGPKGRKPSINQQESVQKLISGVQADDSKKEEAPMDALSNDVNIKEEVVMEVKSRQKKETKIEGKVSASEPEVLSPKSEPATSSSKAQGGVKKSFVGPKSAKLSRKSQKYQKYEYDEDDDDVYPEDFESSSPSKDPPAKHVYDDVGPVFVLEDVRTLSGRQTKRLNLASLSGFRKPRIKVTSPKDMKSKKGVSASPGKPRSGATQKIKTDVPSEVAESAEILASLSSGIPHKEGGSAVDCLKDKTNNQGPVITYEFETMPEDDNSHKEDEGHVPENREEYVELAEGDSLVENVDSDVERDPLDEAERNSAGEYNCDFCDFKTPVKQSLSAHVRKHKENIPKSEHVCMECNKKFSQSCSLQLHLKRHRGERDFHCPDCDYKAFTKVDLTRHQTIHTGERNKICEYCGKTFAKDSTLRDHVKSVHERKVKHACEMCGFITHRANNLRVHIRMRHHGEYNNHVCPVCKASVKQKNAFLEHMRSHTGERPFKCELCTAAFACLARLNVHRNAVHGERQFKCEDCEKSFQTKHHLLRHRAIHTKERPYACPYCSYACNTQGNIAKHVRSIHNLPNFSYRKHKDLIENGGQPREIDPEWIKKGEEVTEEYLNELSSKMGRTITIEELWSKQEEIKRKKEELIRARQEAKERRALKNEAAGVAYLEKVRKRRMERQHTGEPGKKIKKRIDKEGSEDTDPDADLDDTEVPLYKLVSQGGNIRLCLETDKLQVYTGDATREVPLLQVKDDDENDSEEIQTIQGYMNDDGQFIRIEDGVMVDEDSSTVVVIIDSEMQDEINPEVSEVMEVTCEEDFSCTDTEGLNLNVVSKGDVTSKPSVLRVIKQEM